MLNLSLFVNRNNTAYNALRILFLIFAFLPASVLSAEGPPAAIVQTDQAVNIKIAPYVWVTGTIIGRYDSRIAAEVEGNLMDILDVGERVSQGDTLAKIDDRTYRLALDEVEAEILPIETMLEFYEKEAVRLETLAKKNNAAKNQLDETQANRDQSLARIRVVKAKMAMARDDLNKTLVRAPFNGIVTERLKMPGERVDAGDQVVRLVDTERLEIQARIQQSSFQFVKPGDSVNIRGEESEIIGTVRAVIPVGDDISRLYEIRVEFDKPEWPAGKAVDVAVPIRQKQMVIAVPRDALVIRQSGTVVYKINSENIAEVIPVKTGVSNTTHIQILGNVKENDNIVIRGNERLRPGQNVKILDTVDQ